MAFEPARPEPRRFTVEEFLTWDDGTDRRHELVGGEIVAMAPVSRSHSAIAANLARHIGNRLKPPCQILAEAAIRRPECDDRFYRADLAVTCQPATAGERWTPDPVLIIEVLSPSTLAHDRGIKVPDYAAIPSVQEILLVFTETRRAQLWTREGDHWAVRDLIADGAIRLASIGTELSFAAVYENVALP